MKINNTAEAIVWCVGILAAAGVVIGLAVAGWSSEAIIGFAILALGQVAGQAVNARKAATIEAKTDQQTVKIDEIARHTDGELHETVAAAVANGVARATNRGIR